MENEQNLSAKSGTPKPDCGSGQACRESARGVLNWVLEKKLKRMEAIEVLLKVIPWNLLSKREDEILWDYFCEIR